MIQKKEAVKTTFWAGIEQYSTQGIQFLSGIIMARLLLPEAYGILSMIFIFTDLSLMIVDMGFTTALIRKQKCTQKDYSTVFYINVIIGFLVYGLFYLCSPAIASFYNQPVLCDIIPIIGLTFIINAFYAVPSIQLTKKLQFNTRAKITIAASSLSAVCGIILAYKGLGIWALVMQSIAVSLLKSVLYVIVVKWKPSLIFSTNALRELWGFGSKVLGSNILFVFYQNVYSVLIGRYLQVSFLGYFSRADSYSKLVPLNISTVLMKVMLPLISKIQDNDQELVQVNKKVVTLISFLIFPASMMLAGCAGPLISVMITDKWLPCVPLLQILCGAMMFEHLAWINWDFMLVKGKSKMVLQNRILTFVISVGLLLIVVNWGIKWVAVAKAISSLFTVVISSLFLKKVLPLDYVDMYKTLFPMMITSLAIGLGIYSAFIYLNSSLINLIIVLMIATSVYLLIARFLFNDVLRMFVNILKRK